MQPEGRLWRDGYGLRVKQLPKLYKFGFSKLSTYIIWDNIVKTIKQTSKWTFQHNCGKKKYIPELEKVTVEDDFCEKQKWSILIIWTWSCSKFERV